MNFFRTPKNNKELLAPIDLKDCWAKTYCNDEGDQTAGRDVLSHCLIVGHVARSLLSRMPPWLKNDLYPNGSELVAAIHDVGKVCPTFQEKIRRGRNNSSSYVQNSHPSLKNANPEHEKVWEGHACVSQLTAEFCQIGKYIPEIVGQHHGFSPPASRYLASDECFGGILWQNQRENLIEQLKAKFELNWPIVRNDSEARLLAGLTTVSDWIGSSSLFDDPSNDQWKENIETALDNAGFFLPELCQDLSFEDIFNYEPRLIQKKLVDVCTNPGVYILEAPMGIGKTEAALYASYKLMINNKASGFYFALPTQLTSDKIYERVNQFLEKIVSKSCVHRKAILTYANAKLKMAEMGEEGKPGGSWFTANKRELLAPFGVGTIDQVLMSVLNVKHGFVRAFGLAGKVVILDEIHSYDSYTGTIIDKLIESLVACKCTVIILSATLTEERRRSLLMQHESVLKQEYPLISCVKNKHDLLEIPITPDGDSVISIHQCSDDFFAIEEALNRAESGQQVLWIENTVQEAQKIYKILATKVEGSDIACGLLHSRFIRHHRQSIENKWIDLYGKGNSNKRHERGRILIGTQVLEQSIDIDADFLISRICPTDFLLQRLGRLWRHKETKRPTDAKREAWFLSATLESALEDYKSSFGKTAFVYSPYYLIRSLEVWDSLKEISLPKQMRGLIEATYKSRDESEMMNALKIEVAKKKNILQSLARIGLSQDGKTLSDEKASTRYSEQDNQDVLIIQNIRHSDKGSFLLLASGEDIFLPKSGKKNLKQTRELSVSLLENMVKVSKSNAPNPSSRNELLWLKDYLYIGNQEDCLLTVVRRLPSDELVSLDGTSCASKTLNYNATLGYCVED